jgi:peptide/nickel transport system ATP-binding protein
VSVPPLLEVRALSVCYGAAAPALRDASLAVYPAEIVGLAGASGCGKTTLLRAAIGAVPRAGGHVRVLGQDPEALDGAALRALRRRAAYLPQDATGALNPAWPLGRALAEEARLHRRGAADVAEALAAVGLDGRERALPGELSGGERRRATLAMLHLAAPGLVLADEPAAGLDAARKAAIVDLLVAADPRRGVLLVSHDLALLLYRCTRIVVMHDGRTVDVFSPGDARAPERHPETRRLLGAAVGGP